MQRHLICSFGLVLAILPSCAQSHAGFFALVCAPAERCGGGLTCVDSLCVRACSTSDVCSSGEACIEGLCRPPSSGDPIALVCSEDGECPGGGSARCVAGVCTYIDGQTSSCSSDAACSDAAYQCSEGFCTLRDLSSVTACWENSECPSSHVCLTACADGEGCGGVCTPRSACPPSEVCDNGVDDDCNGSIDDCECTGDEDCTDAVCTDGVCTSA